MLEVAETAWSLLMEKEDQDFLRRESVSPDRRACIILILGLCHSYLQLSIIKRLGPLGRCGGHLVYSTCSLEPEENEGVA
jgi:hypothetical protein